MNSSDIAQDKPILFASLYCSHTLFQKTSDLIIAVFHSNLFIIFVNMFVRIFRLAVNFNGKNIQICTSDTTQAACYWWNPRPVIMCCKYFAAPASHGGKYSWSQIPCWVDRVTTVQSKRHANQKHNKTNDKRSETRAGFAAVLFVD